LAQITIAEESAPGTVTLSEPLDKEAVRDLVSRLNDDQVRDLLIQRLDAVADKEDEANKESSVAVLQQGFQRYWDNLYHSLSNIGNIGQVYSKAHAAIKPVLGTLSYWHLALHSLLAIGLGIVATSLWGILKILYTRLSMDILGVIAFGIVSSIVISRLHEPGTYTHGLVNENN